MEGIFESTMAHLMHLQGGKTRSISPENKDGSRGMGGMATEGTGKSCARDLGQGWKVSPSEVIPANSVLTLANIEDQGVIQHIWLTCPSEDYRTLILRFYWDNEENPSVEVPLGDFFCMGWCKRDNLSSFAVCVNPSGGMNCYWQMPFRGACKITIENINDSDSIIYYQVTYSLTEVADNAPYFHAYWNRSNPLEERKNHIIVDKIKGIGHYVGTYLAWGSNSSGWWGEGEIKFFMDHDREYPTICGTGTEDYIGGAWNFEFPQGEYCRFSTPYSGLHQIIKPDGLYASQQRFGMYRWHITDPICFEEDLHVEIQALGWRSGGRYLPLHDDIASVAYWYQLEPHDRMQKIPGKDELEVN